jgi:hypothetical protein
MEGIGLAAAIAMLRDELAQAQDLGEGHQFRFEITDAEVEFLIAIMGEAAAGGKAGFGVVSVGTDAKLARGHTHRLRLKLAVKDEATGGRNLEMGHGRPTDWGAADGPAPSG